MARPNPLDLTVCPTPDVMAFPLTIVPKLRTYSAYEAVLRPSTCLKTCRCTRTSKKTRTAHGGYSAKALQMADEIGFMNFLGNKQLEAYVARKRKEFFASVAGVAAAAVAAAKVASEKQTDDGATGSDSEMVYRWRQ